MGSGVSKKKKSKYETTVNPSARVTLERPEDPKDKKKKKKSKKDKDLNLEEGVEVKTKTKKDKKDKKTKKAEKKEKDAKKKSKVTITLPVTPNVYEKEGSSRNTEEIEESTRLSYSLEANPNRKSETPESENEYSYLYEEEDKRTSCTDPLYENDENLNTVTETEYVTPDNVPDLPPKQRSKTSVKRTMHNRKPVPLPGDRSSGEYENDKKSFIDKVNKEDTVTVNDSDTESEYDDTAISAPAEKKPPIKPKPKPRIDGEDSQEIKVVVAIDFGTTFTGYAYSYVDDKETIHMNPNWAGGKAASFKTPTWVALDKYNELNAFGFEAQSSYNEETEDNEHTVSLYKEFKLQLMKKDSAEEVLVLQSEYGEPLPALKVFGAAVKFLKEKIEKGFRDAGKVFRPWQICWVLTVPAIWDDAQKLFMKEAAREAGLTRNVDDKHLIIALEPEAASLYCRTLKMNMFKGGRGESRVQLPTGTVYIVLDAGGGTIDITVHKVLEGNKIAEIYQANGGPWGGSKINGRFETKLKGILGEDFVVYCQKENPGVWLDLILEFEQAKQSDAARPDSEKPLILTLSLGLNNCYSDFKGGETLKSAIDKYKDSGIRVNKHGKLEVSPENVRGMFSTVVRKTVDHMNNILQKPEIAKASAIFIVGGFGQCPYLQEEIKKNFEKRNRSVLIPDEGNLCVVKGAVMFGHQPDFMSSRIARYTYAYLDKRLYDPSKDKDKETIALENGDCVVLCLTPIITKGEIVDYTEERSTEFEVVTEDFTLPVYCSESEHVDDPNAPDVTQMGELEISLSISKRNSTAGKPEKVRVTFTLSTELKVKGTHLASNTSTETRLQMKSKRRK